MDLYFGTAPLVFDTAVTILRLAASGLIVIAYPYLILGLCPEEPGSALKYLIACLATAIRTHLQAPSEGDDPGPEEDFGFL
jgi:hypothetical protein